MLDLEQSKDSQSHSDAAGLLPEEQVLEFLKKEFESASDQIEVRDYSESWLNNIHKAIFNRFDPTSFRDLKMVNNYMTLAEDMHFHKHFIIQSREAKELEI